MPLFDRVRELPLDHRPSRTGAPRSLAEAHDAADDRHPPARRRARGGRRGRQLRGGSPARVHRRRARRRSRGAHARGVLGARRRPAGLPAAGGSSRRRSTSRSARPGARSPRCVGREPRPVTFAVSQSADPRAGASSIPEIRFKLDASDKWTDEVVAELAATGAVDVVDLKGLYEGEWVDATPSARALPAASPRPSRTHGSRTRAHGRDAAGARAAPRPAHLGLPIHSVADVDALAVAAAVPELEAVALRLRPAALRLLRPLRGARDRALRRRPVRARPGPRARSSTSRRSSTRTRRTTSRRRSTTTAAPGRACRRARSRPRPPSPGSGELQAADHEPRRPQAGRTRARSRRRSRGRSRTLARRARPDAAAAGAEGGEEVEGRPPLPAAAGSSERSARDTAVSAK